MSKFSSDKLKGLVLGFCICLIVTSVVPAIASSRKAKIDVVYDNIKLYVDGNLVIPTDVNGNIVEPFIYDGTTYLPARALSNALTNNSKDVKWDRDNSSIYIGKSPVAAQTDISKIEPYTGDKFITGENAKFILLDETIKPFNRSYGSSSCSTYMLKSNYSEINGQFIIPYATLGNNRKGYLRIYSVDKKGVKTLIKEYTTEAGDDPIPVKANIKGIDILEIQVDGVFYNVNLTGMK